MPNYTPREAASVIEHWRDIAKAEVKRNERLVFEIGELKSEISMLKAELKRAA